MKKILYGSILFMCICCKSNKTPTAITNFAETKTKENFHANEANKAIEYNKSHKKANDKRKEKARQEDQKKLNELNHQKHEPTQKKKKEEGEFKMY